MVTIVNLAIYCQDLVCQDRSITRRPAHDRIDHSCYQETCTYIQTARRGITVLVHSISRTGSGLQLEFLLSVIQARINSQSDCLVPVLLPLVMSCPTTALLMYQKLPLPTSSTLKKTNRGISTHDTETAGLKCQRVCTERPFDVPIMPVGRGEGPEGVVAPFGARHEVGGVLGRDSLRRSVTVGGQVPLHATS
jgi:hypothetical protein